MLAWLWLACVDDAPPAGRPDPGPPGLDSAAPPPTLEEVGFPVASAGGRFTVADLTGDGVDDLVLVDACCGRPAWVRLLAGPIDGPRDFEDPDARFAPVPDRELGPATPAGDVDGDGFVDLAVTATWSDFKGDRVFGGTRILHGPLLGRTEPPRVSAWGPDRARTAWATHAPVGDVDGDGRDDLAISTLDRRLLLTGGDRPGVLAQATFAQEIWQEQLFAPGDLDGDGTPELLFGDDDELFVLPTAGLAGDFALRDAAVGIVARAGHQGSAWHASAGDADGDGRTDLLLASGHLGAPACLLLDPIGSERAMEADAVACWATPGGRNWAPSGVALVPDLDGDGLDEVALAFGGYDEGGLYLVRRGPDGLAPLEDAVLSFEGDWVGLHRGDLTGDGRADLLVVGEGATGWVVPAEALAAALDR